MSLLFGRLLILYVSSSIVGELSANPKNRGALSQHEFADTSDRPFFTDSATKATPMYRRFDETRSEKRSRNATKSDASISRTKTRRIASQLGIVRRKDTGNASSIEYPKILSSRRSSNKTDRHNGRNVKSKSRSDGAATMNLKDMRRKSIGVRREQRVKAKRKRKERIMNDRISKHISKMETNTERSTSVSLTTNDSVIEKMSLHERVPLNVTCRTVSFDDGTLSLRSLFRVPRVRKISDCASRKHRTNGEQRYRGHGQSSAVPVRSLDRGHTELINEYESERSMDIVGLEYVHPDGHVPTSPFPPRIANPKRSVTREPKRSTDFSIQQSVSNVADWKYKSNNVVSVTHPEKLRVPTDRDEYRSVVPKDIVTVDIEIGRRPNDFSSKNKRDTADASIGYRRSSSRSMRTDLSEDPNADSAENIRDEGELTISRGQNSTSQTLSVSRNPNEDRDTTDTPWPLVPGPISCDLDFQLRPSFVAKLGEFDYVVSVQRQRNPDVPADHACTGVVYNPRFVVIAPHCLHDSCDNYGLTVTSTDDLCTIDEMIEVDYIIEHENYDAETRKNDIALIKLKSEIHKKPAIFAKEDGTMGKLFYAVGFGELMWKSYPTKISKLLQKMPVQRYTQASKESAEILDVTASNLDLTGAFRGDFGGALINTRGEFVGLKSKLVKKSMEYEVYTRVRAYLPWIESMVALHGSW